MLERVARVELPLALIVLNLTGNSCRDSTKPMHSFPFRRPEARKSSPEKCAFTIKWMLRDRDASGVAQTSVL